MAEFSIASATLTIAGTPYCASDVSISYTTESLSFLCMDSDTPTRLPGQESWNGSASLAYDDGGMDQLFGAVGTLSFAVTKSSGGTITLSGDVVISDATSVWNKTEVPTLAITFDGDGDLTEVVAP